MICYDFRCGKCGQDYEVIFTSAKDAVKVLPCDACGGEAVHIWKAFGPKGRLGGEKGRYPRFEVQAGRTFHSASEEKSYLKEKGLVQMGPDEYRRSALNTRPEEPSYAGLRACAEEAWQEALQGKTVEHKVVDSSFKWVESKKEA